MTRRHQSLSQSASRALGGLVAGTVVSLLLYATPARADWPAGAGCNAPSGPVEFLYGVPRFYERRGYGGLRYYRQHYPWSRYFRDRTVYPHSYQGQFGDPINEGELTLRYQIAPGISPYSGGPFIYEGMYADPLPEGPWPESEGYESGALQDRPAPSSPPASPAPSEAPEGGQPAVAPRPRLGVHRFATPAPARHGAPSEQEQQAWHLLSEGRAEHARNAFSTVALAYPANSRPKAGFALCASLLGHHADAVLAMRRAFKVDAILLRDLVVDDALSERLRRISVVYQDGGENAGAAVSSADAIFMVAAIAYLRHDQAAARDAARTAIERGDRDLAVLRLMQMLEMPLPRLDPPEPLERPRRRHPELDA